MPKDVRLSSYRSGEISRTDENHLMHRVPLKRRIGEVRGPHVHFTRGVFKIGNMKKAKETPDKDIPKRPQTAFMLWLNEGRSKIKAKNPDMKVTKIAKKSRRQWRELEDKSKWETKAKDAKRLYKKAMKAYKAKQDVD
ncbi:hypothetical protein WA026_006886 [Henosepilachna vigintioctopunctata]|uniref:HMG box domain-containing protein n=1 Tax=Henosepilachna vigintioctopunctata TaxID=420089 RepID=A0AAW1VBA5_9CUCU